MKESILQIFEKNERRVFDGLKTPKKIQSFLDKLPINFETKGETYMSPRRVLRERTAHCFEGALLAAAALYYHGQKPLLLDLRTTNDDEDHVVALFKQEGSWGAISKTNHAILRYRDPVYKTVRELVLSYFHEYIIESGKKTLREYSRPFDLTRYDPKKWLTAEEDLSWLVDALDICPHYYVASKKVLQNSRRAGAIEIKAMSITEWPRK